MDFSSEVRLSQLDYKRYQVQIAQGTVTFRVMRTNDAQVEISTPSVSVQPVSAGTYRITVRPDGITEITVRGGQATIYGPRGSENLSPGQTMQVRDVVGGDPEFQVVSAIPLDDFDQFNINRDRVMQQTPDYRNGNLPPDVAGGESLDPYGQWQNDPNYGQVWVPNEPPGWAPYQDGRWVDEDYYGWTWVSADPWGWAPYHYGSWYMGPSGWAWYPGFGIGPHYWRPAMVGFFGWGAPGLGIGVGFGFGNVGWVPLGPFEAFHPWYGAGAVAAGRIGGANIGVANAYRNARVTGAISSMSAANFGRGAVSAAGMVRPSGADLARASAIHGSLSGIQATSASRRMSDAAVNSRGMPHTSANTHFASRAAIGANASARGSSGAAPAWRSMNGYNAGRAAGARGTPGATAGGANAGGARGAAAAPQSNYRYYGGSQQQGQYATQNRTSPQQQQPLRMNPPIVQQRGNSSSSSSSSGRSSPAPSRSGGGGGGGHGGGGHR